MPVRAQKRKFEGRERSSEEQQSKLGKRIKTGVLDGETQSTKEELREFMKTIKEFNAHSELGNSRKKYKEDLLTKLGAPPPKQQKMPFKLRLKLDAARKIREDRKLNEMKQSDEVTVQHKALLQKAQKRKLDRKNRK